MLYRTVLITCHAEYQGGKFVRNHNKLMLNVKANRNINALCVLGRNRFLVYRDFPEQVCSEYKGGKAFPDPQVHASYKVFII